MTPHCAAQHKSTVFWAFNLLYFILRPDGVHPEKERILLLRDEVSPLPALIRARRSSAPLSITRACGGCSLLGAGLVRVSCPSATGSWRRFQRTHKFRPTCTKCSGCCGIRGSLLRSRAPSCLLLVVNSDSSSKAGKSGLSDSRSLKSLRRPWRRQSCGKLSSPNLPRALPPSAFSEVPLQQARGATSFDLHSLHQVSGRRAVHWGCPRPSLPH